MKLIDTHTHLYSEEFTGGVHAVIQRAQQNGVAKFYLPGIDSTVIGAMLQLEQQYPGVCLPMMGLHPCYVKENYLEELAVVEEWLNKRPFAAVGEIGVDLYWDKTFIDQQRHAFTTQMQWALNKQMPIVIHTREAMDETIAMVRPFAAKGLRGIFHCFSGNATQAQEVVNMGFYLGIGGVLTYKKGGLPEALQNISLNHMVLETDAPYLAPVPYRGKRNESGYLVHIIEKLAEVKQVPVAEVAAITTANAEKIFGS